MRYIEPETSSTYEQCIVLDELAGVSSTLIEDGWVWRRLYTYRFPENVLGCYAVPLRRVDLPEGKQPGEYYLRSD
jgi:hypothetical protein